MKIGVIIPVHNRQSYLEQCLHSVQMSDLPDNVHFYLIDDCSTEPVYMHLPLPNVNYFKYDKNQGIKKTLLWGFEHAIKEGCDMLCNLDSDALVTRDWLKRLLQLQSWHADKIVSGFDVDNPLNKVIKTHADGSKLKDHANGINMLFSASVYQKHIKPALQSEGNWDFNSTAKVKAVICNVVQHIGLQSTLGHTGAEVSPYFHDLHLPDVTLFGVDAHDPKGLLRAAAISKRFVKFGGEKIITERLFSGREAYSRFCIKDMAKYIETSHALIIHPDGYIVNHYAWDNAFLDYDYVGATWAYKDNMNVGNGGFSLRSKKLLDIISTMDLPNYHPEDHVICRDLRPQLEKQGIRFAPEDVANRFSIEAYGSGAFIGGNKYNGAFGFHSYHIDWKDSNIPYSIQPQRTNASTHSKSIFRNR